MQNKLRFIEKQIRRYEIEKSEDIEIAANAAIEPSVLNKMEAKLGQTFDRLQEANDAFENLLEDLETLIELKHCLEQTLPILKRVRARQQAVKLRSGASLTDKDSNKQPLLCGCEDTCNDMKVK
ncbi:hypothetical protein AAVH_39981 [Aphelenchoides avenae]|nr:hypothetical protein AAVH_39981 [Aphelenchus avenae]